jgi:hypothetical protein
MQKSEYISMQEAGKTGRKINMANLKVSRANAQSRPAGFYLHRQIASCILKHLE